MADSFHHVRIFQHHFHLVWASLVCIAQKCSDSFTNRWTFSMSFANLRRRRCRVNIIGEVGPPGKQGTPGNADEKLGVEFWPPGPCMCTLFLFSAYLVNFHEGGGGQMREGLGSRVKKFYRLVTLAMALDTGDFYPALMTFSTTLG